MTKSVRTGARSRWVAAMLCLSATAHTASAFVREDVRPTVTTTPADDQSTGLVPRRLVWPGVAVIIVVAVIVTAALTGPIIRANTDDEDGGDSSPPISSD